MVVLSNPNFNFRYSKYSNSSVAAVVWGITRVADATAQAYAGKFNLMSSENTALLSLNLRINSQKRYNDNLIGPGQCVAETKRTFPVAKFSDYWNTAATQTTTHQMLGNLVGQCYCTSCLSGIDSTSVQS